LPRPHDPWLAFVALLGEYDRLEAGARLQAIEGPAIAVANLAGDSSQAATRQLYLQELEQIARGTDPRDG
jgi:hypothetical protein